MNRHTAALFVALALGAAPFATAQLDDSEIGKAVVGKAMFKPYCVSCHGAQGHGDGNLAKGMDPKPANLTQISKANDGVFPMERVLKVIDGREPVAGHSTKDMPAWGDVLASRGSDPDEVAARIEQLALYVKSIQEQ